MKAVMIIYNQANNERVEYMLDTLGIRGFSQWVDVQGRGNVNGDPHRGTHTWPEMNNAILTVVPDDKVDELLLSVRKLDKRNEEVGIRAFAWNIEQMV
jgi:nitrogen regulatory protein PII